MTHPAAPSAGWRNVNILVAASAMGAASPPIIISLGGIVGQSLSPVPALATLPVSLYTLGVALGTIPAAVLSRRFGRLPAYLAGALVAFAGGLVATFGIVQGSFLVFCLGTLLAGYYGANVQSYRFAAADAVNPSERGKAISRVMIGGLIAAIIGPQLVIWTRDSIPGIPFAGSFFSQSALALLALPILLLLRLPPEKADAQASTGRPLTEIMATPRFILGASAGVISYALMSFVMTAAPIAMVGCGHTIGEAALGIQWHVLAMFAPSFVTGRIMARIGKEKVTALGLGMIAVASIVALTGLEVAHFWISLILLGIGWNFGFIGSTAMITDCYQPEERAKVQGANDFLVFGSVCLSSFGAGTLLDVSGWQIINILVLPIVAVILVPVLWRIRHPFPA